MEKAVVLGGAGFIGSHLVHRLLDENFNVYVLDDYSVGRSIVTRNIRPDIVRDVRSITPQEWSVFLERERPSIIYYLPAVCNSVDLVRYAYDSYDVTVRGLSHLLAGMRISGVFPRIVYFSSSEVYGEDENANDSCPRLTMKFDSRAGYDVGKMAGEAMLHAFSLQFPLLNYVSIRPFNVYGPYEEREGAIIKLMLQSLRGEPMTIYGDGSATRAFTYIDDFLDGLDCVVSRGESRQAYNISTTQESSMNELAALIGSVTGNGAIKHLPHPYDEVAHRGADISKVVALGFVPRVTLYTGLCIVADWLKHNKDMPMRYYDPGAHDVV